MTKEKFQDIVTKSIWTLVSAKATSANGLGVFTLVSERGARRRVTPEELESRFWKMPK